MSFHPNTVFIIGAGAGFDHKMPLGTDLANSIMVGGDIKYDQYGERGREAIQGDAELFSYVRYRTGQLQQMLPTAMRRIARGITTAESIDSFIHRFQGDSNVELAGKLLIAWYILKAERESTLRVDPNSDGAIDPEASRNGWLRTFATMLFAGYQKDTIGELPDRVRIICFNYDRCLERYLQDALKRGFELTWEDAHALVKRMHIIHPYGHLGPLPVAPHTYGNPDVAYGSDPEYVDLISIARGLRTFTEATETEVSIRIRDMMQSAERVVSLGFAFHSPNVKLLSVDKNAELKQLFASGIGLSHQEKLALDQITHRMLGHRQGLTPTDTINIEIQADCKRLLEIHRLNLLER